ncbi:MAG: dUTP diphosphatase [Solirubrobacterales bacterium]
MSEITIRVECMDHARGLSLPAYQTNGSSGVDLVAAVEEPITIQPGKLALVPTGLKIAIPQGYEAQVRPRSGLALKHALTVLNTPGTIDADYRGEVKIIVMNLGESEYTVTRGERIAQMVFCKVEKAVFLPVDVLDETERGQGGFGHTGN